MKLNLGCGDQTPEGWVNVDYALGARAARLPFFRGLNKRLGLFNQDWNERIFIHDLTRPFPWPAESADVIYSSHTLEHFTREEGRRFLARSHQTLRSGGVIRIVVPDLKPIVEEYVRGELRADDFLEALSVLYEPRGNPVKDKLSHLVQFPHKCMYDGPTLLAAVREAGFSARPREPFDSDIPDIRSVEAEGRTRNAAIVEGVKP